MKKRVTSLFFGLSLLLALSFSISTSDAKTTPATLIDNAGGGYFCKTSSNPDLNDGFCRALSTGHGDMCFTYGSGTPCSGTGGN